jgi:hypothetical protein
MTGSPAFELSLDERGAYITIVSMIYARGGPITQTSDWPRQFDCYGKVGKLMSLRGKAWAAREGGSAP